MVTPIYDPTVPEHLSDTFKTSQPQLKNNFQTLFEAFLVNHISINDPSNAGNHTFVDLLEQSNSILTDIGQIAIYTKDVKGQTDQVFFRYQNQGQEFQFTNYQLYSLPPQTGVNQFFTFLPGRVIVYFGSFTALEKGLLQLLPMICINPIGMAMSPMNTNALPGTITIPAPVKGIYQSITTMSFDAKIGQCPPSFYIILGNT